MSLWSSVSAGWTQSKEPGLLLSFLKWDFKNVNRVLHVLPDQPLSLSQIPHGVSFLTVRFGSSSQTAVSVRVLESSVCWPELRQPLCPLTLSCDSSLLLWEAESLSLPLELHSVSCFPHSQTWPKSHKIDISKYFYNLGITPWADSHVSTPVFK